MRTTLIRAAMVFALAVAALEAPVARAAAADAPCGEVPVESALKVDHFVFFPDKRQADTAAGQLDASQLRHMVRPAAQGTEWVLYVEHRVVPTLAAFKAEVAELTRLAGEHGGRYGWHGCRVG